MFKVSETHYAATWLLHPYAPKVTPPKEVMRRREKFLSLKMREVI
jgi:oligopeptide transport system ATP-binding protein